MKRSAVVALVGAALVLAAGMSARAEDGDDIYVRWESHREATERARAEDKPLLLHFTAPWCKWCDKMRRETYADRAVRAYLNEQFTMAMIDTEKLPGLARKYGVKGLPTLWFLSADGKRLTRLDGFVSAENLLPLLEFVATKAYETYDYQPWLERRR